MQDHHHAHPTIVECFHRIVVCLRYDGGLPEKLTEVDQMGGSQRLCRQNWVRRSYCSPPHFQHAEKFS